MDEKVKKKTKHHDIIPLPFGKLLCKIRPFSNDRILLKKNQRIKPVGAVNL